MQLTSYQQIWKMWSVYERTLSEFVLKRTGDQQLAEDIIHDVLIKVHGACCSGHQINNFKSWLYRIAQNTTIDAQKSRRKEVDNCCERSDDGDENIYAELSIFLDRLIGFLPDKYGALLRLADIDNMRQTDIARRTGLSHTAVKSRVQRARKLLRAEIHECFHVEVNRDSGLVDFVLKDSCLPLRRLNKNNL